MAESLARDIVAAPHTGLGATMDRFAGGLGDRYAGFGIGRAPAEASLVHRVFDRWQPRAGLRDLSVFGAGDLSGLVREWGAYDGYDRMDFEAGGPFVVPVDPIEHPTGLTAQQATRRSRGSLFAQARPRQAGDARPTARETWRATDAAGEQLSPYPAAMGRAGAIDRHLLRFPDARAVVQPSGPAARSLGQALITDAGPGRAWGPTAQRLTPAITGAEAMADALFAAASGATDHTRAADAWLVDSQRPEGRARLAGATAHRPGRLGDVHRIGLRAQRRLDASPRGPSFGREDLGALVAPTARAGSPDGPAPAAIDRPRDRGPALAPAAPGSPAQGRAAPIDTTPGALIQPAAQTAPAPVTGLARALARAEAPRPAPVPASPARAIAPVEAGPLGAAAAIGPRPEPTGPFVPATVARLLDQAGPAPAASDPDRPWASIAWAGGAGDLVQPTAAAPEVAGVAATAEAASGGRAPTPAANQAMTPVAATSARAEPAAPALSARPGSPLDRLVTAGTPAPRVSAAASGSPRALDPLQRAVSRGTAQAGDPQPWPGPAPAPAGPRAAARALSALIRRLTAGGGAVPPAFAEHLWTRLDGADAAQPRLAFDEVAGALVQPTADANLDPQAPIGAAQPRAVASPRPSGPMADRPVDPLSSALAPALAAGPSPIAAAATSGGAARPALGPQAPPLGAATRGLSPTVLDLLLGRPDAAGDAGLSALLAGTLGRADALLARFGQSTWAAAAQDPAVQAAFRGAEGPAGVLVQPTDGPAPDPLSPDAPARSTTEPAPRAGASAAAHLSATPGQRVHRTRPPIGRSGASARAFGARRLGLRGAPSPRWDGPVADGVLVRPVGPMPDAPGGLAAAPGTGGAAAPSRQPSPAPFVPGQLPATVQRALAATRPEGLGGLAPADPFAPPAALDAWAQADARADAASWARSAGLAGAPGDLVAPMVGTDAAPQAPAALGAADGGPAAARPARGADSARPMTPAQAAALIPRLLAGALGTRAQAFATHRAELDARLFGPVPTLSPAAGRSPAALAAAGWRMDSATGALVALPGGPQATTGTGGGAAALGGRTRDVAGWLPGGVQQALADAAAWTQGAGGRASAAGAAWASPAGAPGEVVRPATPAAGHRTANASSAPSLGAPRRRRPMQPANVERAMVAFGKASQAQAAQQGVAAVAASVGASPQDVVGAVGALFRPSQPAAGPSIGRAAATQARPSMRLPGSLFADRGPNITLGKPGMGPGRVMVDPSRSASAEALRSTPGQRPQRKAETAEGARHRNADQSEDSLSPEEVERIARDVITMLEREAEFDLDRLGEDYD